MSSPIDKMSPTAPSANRVNQNIQAYAVMTTLKLADSSSLRQGFSESLGTVCSLPLMALNLLDQNNAAVKSQASFASAVQLHSVIRYSA